MKGITTLADVVALEKSPPRDLPASTYEMIQRGVRLNPKAPALSFFLRTQDHKRPEVWTYENLLANIHRAANLFHELGVDKDQVVAFVLPNLPETHFTIWGGQAAGIAYAINPLLEASAIAELLRAAKARVLVTLAPFPGTDLWTKVQTVLDQVPSLRHVVLVNLADRVPGVKRLGASWLQMKEVRRLHGHEGIRGAVPSTIRIHDFKQGLKRQVASRLVSGRVIKSTDYSSFFCTGGTTGTPKIAMRRHENEVANAWSATQFLGDGMNAAKNIFCGLPLFHVNGVLVTGLAPFSKGAHVILGTPQGYRGEGVVARFWELVEHHKVNFFSGVPTLYSALLQVPIANRNVSSLEYGLCGAAPMPVEVLRTFQERTGLKILEGYGLTEGTCVSSTNPPLGHRKLGSIGLRIPLQAMKAILLNDDGQYLCDCGVDEVGVIVISGPNVFAGYKVPEHNKGLWMDLGDGRQWLNTGDLGRQDAEGYFYLTGRKKELIIRGGHNLDPQTIEEPLHQHPDVQIAAAVGRPDAHAGELPVAYVQLKPGSVVSESELMLFAAEHITERAAIPKSIHIIEQMPLTGVGKIFKPDLKLRETRDALSNALSEGGLSVEHLNVVNDSTRGFVIEVRLVSPADEARARQILGLFPFAFTLMHDVTPLKVVS
ncbi:MAG: acyl-CoA synthetase [Rubrivivax sp.]|nr:MAG: acyl-CoA synthetase [Rubrivivax sp.]